MILKKKKKEKKGSSSFFLMVLDYDTWHNVNMPCGIFWNFGQNELKSIYE
jgi:hypothetical protein